MGATASRLAPGVRVATTLADLRGPVGAAPAGGPSDFDSARNRDRRNAKGGMLMYEVAFAKKDPSVAKYNRINGQVNGYKYSIERGMVHLMPWFVVDFWRTNLTTTYEQRKDGDTLVVIANDQPPETLTHAAPIDPPKGFVDGEHVEVSIARWREEEAVAAEKVYELALAEVKEAKKDDPRKPHLEQVAEEALEVAQNRRALAIQAARAIDPNRGLSAE